ncbi:hypothetical protein PR202_gb22701 [Eleusine coracana subsp. coracana]|uniref:Secreted protein n=1 Tax=Eleusine coracana subsp. coracana TaxID=191504 RepID=A0AAV5FEC9_ELECO|nr:hypothetical protein PR202_gb22701 [Eleusine coracana subsp. coracana]
MHARKRKRLLGPRLVLLLELLNPMELPACAVITSRKWSTLCVKHGITVDVEVIGMDYMSTRRSNGSRGTTFGTALSSTSPAKPGSRCLRMQYT